jgi:ABC-type lipoprotein export system ATPase subunit
MSGGGAGVITFDRVVKDYGGLRPLRIASLEIRERERIALGGVDAVAAEALVNLVTGAVLPNEGSIWVLGTPTGSITDADAWLGSLDRFGIVSERAVMLETSTFLQNLALPLSLDIDAIPPDVKRRVEGLATAAGVPLERLGVRVAEGTPDERARAQVARALAFDPSILLLEHPSAALPRDRVGPFASDLAALVTARGITALAITEDAEFAKPFATRWLTIKPGTGEAVPAKSKWKLLG